MKKLVTAACALAAGIAMADVTSGNTVGYTTFTSVAQNNFITVPFDTIGYNTTSISNIIIRDENDTGLLGWGSETFSIWEGAPSVVEGIGFFYYDPVMDPDGGATDYYWGDASGYPVSFSIPAGQAVVIDTSSLGAGYTFLLQGQVSDEPVTFTSVAQNNFTGNPYADPIDIQAISISDPNDTGMLGWGSETFSIWEGAPSVVAGVGFFYYDPVMDPDGGATDYYWGDASGYPATFSIAPGQGVVIDTSSLGAGYTFSIDCPYTL